MNPLTPFEEHAQPETMQSLIDLFKNCKSKESGIVAIATFVAAAYDKPVTEELLANYVEALGDMREDQIARGFAIGRRESEFFPTVRQVRMYGGAATEEDRSRDALMWLIAYLQRYGAKGEDRPPTYDINAGAREPGTHFLPLRPAEPAPVLPDVLKRTLCLLGDSHDHTKGFDVLATHPSFSKWEQNGGHPVWIAEKLEARFLECYRRARNGFGGDGTKLQMIRR